jgi:hypothetical protein
MPHLPVHPSDREPCVALLARTDPNEQGSVVLPRSLEHDRGGRRPDCRARAGSRVGASDSRRGTRRSAWRSRMRLTAAVPAQ